MGRQASYTLENRTINLGDIFNVEGTRMMVKEIFTLNNQTYISYDIEKQEGLSIELIDKFIEDKSNYFNTVIPNPIADTVCGLGEKK
jgi:hypothetical protein